MKKNFQANTATKQAGGAILVLHNLDFKPKLEEAKKVTL
jgi:predicted outer membrane repeat protein